MRNLYILPSVVLLFLMSNNPLLAQEEATYRQYIINPYLINPAYAGFEDRHVIFLNYHTRWANFADNGVPKTVTASYNGPVGNRIGLGASFLSDRVASYERTKAQLSYAFNFKLQEVQLALGLSTAYEEIALDGSALLGSEYEPGDPLVAEAIGGIETFDAAFGIHGRYDKMQFGVAFPSLVRARLEDNPLSEEKSEFGQYYLAYVTYLFDLEGYNFNLEPTIMFRQAREADFEVDFNLKANFYEDQLTGALTYTLGGGGRLSVLLGTSFDNFGLFYTYSTSFREFQQYSDGAHELSVAFKFGNRKGSVEDQ